MQNRYLGDIADFGKFGILRFLSGMRGGQALALGTIWYLNEPDEVQAARNEGNLINYLNVSLYNELNFRVCDPDLYDFLRQLVGASLVNGIERNVGQIPDGAILPNASQYYDGPVLDDARHGWFDAALDQVNDAELVFLDPDIGMETQRNHGRQYALVNELTRALDQGKSLVVYQNPSRNRNTDLNRIQNLNAYLSQHLQDLGHHIQQPIRAFVWQSRFFLIITSNVAHQGFLWDQLERFQNSDWYGHGRFTEVNLNL